METRIAEIPGLLLRSHTENITRWTKRKSLKLGLQQACNKYSDASNTLQAWPVQRTFSTFTADILQVQSNWALHAIAVYSQWTQSCNGHRSGSAHATAGKDGTCNNISPMRTSIPTTDSFLLTNQAQKSRTQPFLHLFKIQDVWQTPASSITREKHAHGAHRTRRNILATCPPFYRIVELCLTFDVTHDWNHVMQGRNVCMAGRHLSELCLRTHEVSNGKRNTDMLLSLGHVCK